METAGKEQTGPGPLPHLLSWPISTKFSTRFPTKTSLREKRYLFLSNWAFRSSGRGVWASQVSAARGSICSHCRATFSIAELRWFGSSILAAHGAARSGYCHSVWLT
jgi:hypothetical protein